jgi:hypothetical protein
MGGVFGLAVAVAVFTAEGGVGSPSMSAFCRFADLRVTAWLFSV